MKILPHIFLIKNLKLVPIPCLISFNKFYCGFYLRASTSLEWVQRRDERSLCVHTEINNNKKKCILQADENRKESKRMQERRGEAAAADDDAFCQVFFLSLFLLSKSGNLYPE